MKYKFIVILLIASIRIGFTQTNAYEVTLEPLEIEGLGGLQSYAYATYEGEWLIVGGRLDGLHQRQPFAAFDPQGNNIQLMVVNPLQQKVWKASIGQLSVSVKEQLSSSNMQFYQDGQHLILTGGYGFSPSKDDHITYPYLTIIDVPSAIAAIKQNNIMEQHFTQFEDETFSVTGGRLSKLDSTFYLVGGHKFVGRYNPMGPTHGPGFEQTYSNEARRFTINYSASPKVVDIKSPLHDEMNLHRRDYNLMPIMYQGKEALMVYSGVFQNNADLPWLFPVIIQGDDLIPISDFDQKFNHYHCANVSIYNAQVDEMHSIFFGGIAQFYKSGDTIVQDNDVPFVKTIADVVKISDGTMTEMLLNEEMPDYFGAGSEFIFAEGVDFYDIGIVDGDRLSGEALQIGYIFGGIKSLRRNIFWINDGTQSEATATIFKVAVRKSTATSTHEHNSIANSLLIYPNPAHNQVRLAFKMDTKADVKIIIYDEAGKTVQQQTIDKSEVSLGMNYLNLNDIPIEFGAYLYSIQVGNELIQRKVVITE